MSHITIDQTCCRACGICIQECPVLTLRADANGRPVQQDADTCIDCGRCVALCPHPGAITHAAYEPAQFVALNPDLLPDAESVIELLRARRSVRAFKKERLDQAVISTMIEGAQLAPSSHNTRSTQVVVVQDAALLEQIGEQTRVFLAQTIKLLKNPVGRRIGLLVARREVEESLPLMAEFERFVEQGDDPILHHAPALLIFHAPRANSFGAMNAALVMSNAMLIGQSLGVGSLCIGTVMAACKRDRSIANLLHLPAENQIYGALAVGYPRFRAPLWVKRPQPEIAWM
ncbi:MAG TPA: nitroreductase family protein [Aggregatilineaceae bacterium]|nr:nitroreductase family protein [Aggregatilineaceae bacterium]